MKASEDLGEDELPEFSDDEEERAYFAMLKTKQNKTPNKFKAGVGSKRMRTSGIYPFNFLNSRLISNDEVIWEHGINFEILFIFLQESV